MIDIEDLKLWLAEIEAIVGRCKLSLESRAGGGLCLQVEWSSNRQSMGYEHTLSGSEMKYANRVFQGVVLEQIKCKITCMDEMQRGLPH